MEKGKWKRAIKIDRFPIFRFPFSMLDLVNRANLTALVITAVRAYLMGRLRFLALRAGPDGDGLQSVVCAALGGAALGVPPFWIRHRSVLLVVAEQPLEGRHPLIFPLRRVAAVGAVQIRPAYGTQAFARFGAQRLHGQR